MILLTIVLLHHATILPVPLVKSPRNNKIETSNTSAQNTPKETITESKNVNDGSDNNNYVGKNKSSIDIARKKFKNFKNKVQPISQRRKMRRT